MAKRKRAYAFVPTVYNIACRHYIFMFSQKKKRGSEKEREQK